MSTPTAGQAAHSTPKTKARSNPTPPTTTSTWRCAGNERLHRDSRACVNFPPSSPIIDTPSKRMRLERKLAGEASQLQSQATTQPTPSRPPKTQTGHQASFSTSIDGKAGSASPSANSNGWFQLLSDSASIPPSAYVYPSAAPSITPSNNGTIVPAVGNLFLGEPAIPDWTDGNDPLQNLKGRASEESRIPETPLDPSTMRPLPRLTESNLKAFNSRVSSAGDQAECSAIQVPGAPSLTPTAAAQIRRLVLRSRINNLHHQASQAELAIMNQNLTAAEELAREEASRRKGWRVVCLSVVVACAVYAAWCWYWSAEFEYIRLRARDHFGL